MCIQPCRIGCSHQSDCSATAMVATALAERPSGQGLGFFRVLHCTRHRTRVRAGPGASDKMGNEGLAHEQSSTISSTEGSESNGIEVKSLSTALRDLGWEALIDDCLAPMCSTKAGRREVLTTEPATTMEEAQTRLDATKTILEVEKVTGNPLPLHGSLTEEAGEALKEARAGQASTVDGILAVRNCHDSAAGVDDSLEEASRLGVDVGPVATLRGLVQRRSREMAAIAQVVDDETGSLKDDASTELRRAREAKGRAERSAKAALEQRGFGREIDRRNNRLVIMVQKENLPKGAVARAYFAGGAIVAAEPLEVVQANNELDRAVKRESEAEYELRRFLTSTLRSVVDDLESNLQAVKLFDAIAARARLAYESEQACMPELVDGHGDEGGGFLQMHIEGLKHPVLDQRLRRQGEPGGAVPIDIPHFGEKRRGAIITGPNAGGKTAAIKAVGLAALMARSGMLVPAKKAVMPLLEPVMADIGESQDLSAGLSRFSARVAKAKAMANSGGPHAIALIDELGAATSPAEGAALGAALVRELLESERALFVLSTAHHVGLAALGLRETGQLVSASVEFDEERLQPTHKVLWGVPGRSRALDIADRMGMPQAIIQRARSRLPPGRTELDEVAKALERFRSAGERDRREAERLKRENEGLEAQKRELEREVDRMDRQARAEVARRVSVEGEAMLSQLKKARSNKRRQGGQGRQGGAHEAKGGVSPGDKVQLKESGMEGEVVSVDDEADQLVITAGGLTVPARRMDVKLLLTGGGESKSSGRRKRGKSSKKKKKPGGSSLASQLRQATGHDEGVSD